MNYVNSSLSRQSIGAFWRFLFLSLLLWVASPQSVADEEIVSYSESVRPILASQCFGCHQPARSEGDLVMTRFEAMLEGGATGDPAIVPGKPDESYLVELITAHDGKAQMPPDSDPLTEDQVNTIRTWIEQGANPDLRNKDNVPVLHIAVQNKRIEAIPSLVNSGADVNIRRPKCVHLASVTPSSKNKFSFIFLFQSRQHCSA